MKRVLILSASLLTLCALIFTACLKDSCTNEKTFTQWTPIYKTDAELKETPQYGAARPMKNPGKIYFYGKYILVNEEKEGIHIIDNGNPSNPQAIGFLKIAGNVDMAVKNNYLYADNYNDLLTFDISTITAPRLTCRAENIFRNIFQRDPTRGWLVDYKVEEVTQKIDCNDPRYQEDAFWQGNILFSADTRAGASAIGVKSGSTASAPAGVGGSMARFTTYQNYFYAIDRWQLHTFNLARLDCPSFSNSTNVNWNIETVFPYKDKLFIGSTTGMFIYDLSNPATPVQLARFEHGRACDPVVVENDIAYITLRSGTTCNTDLNQMQIVDVSNLRAPRLLNTYSMKNPRGLSVWDKMVYLCDDGLKIYDATDRDKLPANLKAHIAGFDTFDVIAYEYTGKKYLMVIGKDGFYQFDVTDPTKPKEVSKIPVTKS
jgi:hypothetical protein